MGLVNSNHEVEVEGLKMSRWVGFKFWLAVVYILLNLRVRQSKYVSFRALVIRTDSILGGNSGFD